MIKWYFLFYFNRQWGEWQPPISGSPPGPELPFRTSRLGWSVHPARLLSLRKGPLWLRGFVCFTKKSPSKHSAWSLELCLYAWTPETSLPTHHGHQQGLSTALCVFEAGLRVLGCWRPRQPCRQELSVPGEDGTVSRAFPDVPGAP